jgi:HAMP domain-containing protein
VGRWTASARVVRDGSTVGVVRVQPWPHGGWSGWTALLALSVVLVMLWAMSGRIAWKLAWPLEELTRVARDLGEGRLQSRFDVRFARGEVRSLAEVMNGMAERIERQLKDQRELLAAVSHELRTPLARVRLLLELGRGGDTSVLDQLEHEVLEMDALVGELLASARLDFTAMARLPLDAGDLRDAGAGAGGAADVPAGDGVGPVSLEGDPTLLSAPCPTCSRTRGCTAGATRLGWMHRTVWCASRWRMRAGPARRRRAHVRPFQRGEVSDGLGLGLALVGASPRRTGNGVRREPRRGARPVGFTVRAPAERRG